MKILGHQISNLVLAEYRSSKLQKLTTFFDQTQVWKFYRRALRASHCLLAIAVLPHLLAFVSGRSTSARLAFFYQQRTPTSAKERSSSPEAPRRKADSPNRRLPAPPRVVADVPPGGRAVYRAPEVLPRPGVADPASAARAASRGHSAATPIALVRGPAGEALFLADLRRHVLRGSCIYFLREAEPAPYPSSAGPSPGGTPAFQSLVGRITCGEITAPVSRRRRPPPCRAPTPRPLGLEPAGDSPCSPRSAQCAPASDGLLQPARGLICSRGERGGGGEERAWGGRGTAMGRERITCPRL